jgi:hypothetical protein
VRYKVAAKELRNLQSSGYASGRPSTFAPPPPPLPVGDVHAIQDQANRSACGITRKSLLVLGDDWPPGPFLRRCAQCNQHVRAGGRPL